MATTSPFGAAAVPALNPITAQIPNFAQQTMLAQRQQAMAQALTQQGMAPIDFDPRGHISWTQGLAKMLQTYEGMKIGNSAMNSQAGLQTQAMQGMGPHFGMGGSDSPQGNPQALASALDPQAAAAAQQAMAQGAKQGSVGPTTQNAAAMSQIQAQQPPSPQAPQPQAQPAPQGQQGGDFVIPGMSPTAAMTAYMQDPTGYMKQLADSSMPTEMMKNNRYMGMSPQQQLAIAQSKATGEGFHSFAPGEAWTNTLTGQGGFAPKVPDNSQPNAAFTPGSPIPSVGLVPGAQGVSQGNATASAVGSTAGGVHTVTNPDGSQTAGLGSSVFQIPPAQQAAENASSLKLMQQELADPKWSPKDRASIQAEIDRLQSTGSPTSVPQSRTVTGPNASFAPMVGQGGKLLSDAQTAQTNNQSTYSYLDEMKQLSSGGAAFGPGTANIAKWKALANNYIPGIDLTGAQTNQDVMHKLASTLAGSQSPRSDADLSNWQARYPSGDLTNAAITQLIPILQKQANVVDARANVMTRASSNGLEKLPDLANKFNQIASPALVSDGRSLAQASQAGPQAVQAFVGQYKAAHPADWKNRLQTIQQLDGMGAF